MARKTKVELARERNEIAKLILGATIAERRTRLVSEYDAVKSGVKRRQAIPETQSEDKIYSQRLRQLGNNIGRDLERNYAPAKGMIHQFRMNVAGSQGKLQVNIKGGEDASAWFNQIWSKDCDYRDEMHWSDECQNVVASVIREGDLIAVFDDGLVEDSGKLLHWESDQIVPVQDTILPDQYKNAMQENGIIRDSWGKVLAYIVTGKRGLTMLAESKDATFLPRDEARHVKNPWRLNQGRGIPSIITNATNFLDLYEGLAAELQSFKRASQIAGYTKRGGATTDFDATGAADFLPENTDKAAATTDAECANGTDPAAKNYERFENLTGGLWEYVDKDDEIKFPDMPRPNTRLAPFIEAILGYAGASMGLARAYSLLRADSSYTSFRGDMILSWASAFYPMQKWLERRYADWVGRKALAWGVRHGKFAALPEKWEQSLSWVWPSMPAVDKFKEEQGIAQSLKNATTDYSKLLGPDWEKKLKALADQLEFGRKNNLPLSVFEQKSGGAAPSESDSDDSDEEIKPKKTEEK